MINFTLMTFRTSSVPLLRMGDTELNSSTVNSDLNSCTLNSEHCHSEKEDLLRRKLKYFFMNPCQKWKAKRKFPWKLVLQIIKIVLVTVQLAIFGIARSSHVDFLEKSEVSFHHLFVKDWEASLETMPYPPSSGTFAVYTIEHFYDSINYALMRYESTEDIALGTYQFHDQNNTKIPPAQLCNNHFRLSHNWSHNQSYQFDSEEITTCIDVLHIWDYNNDTGQFEKKYDIKEFLRRHNYSKIDFDGVNHLYLNFNLTAIHLKYLSRLNLPDCYIFEISLHYDNSDHYGQVAVSLSSTANALTCFGSVNYNGNTLTSNVYTVFDAFVILVSGLSMLLCFRSVTRAHKLRLETVEFFSESRNTPLSISDHLEFLNMWYVLIIINDLLTLMGTSFKIGIDHKFSQNYEVCGIMLGTGSLLVWFGVLRYLGFFDKYNILILTMKKSAPNILRFLVCAGVFYFGFTVCGWVVLGPYHIKFRHISSASQCLFSLVNGDDMFVTFAAINNSSYVWWYSQIYLYVFISLFIYVVLSVFISVIMDTYDTIKKSYRGGIPKSFLEAFADECTDDAHALFRSYSSSRFRDQDRTCSLCTCACDCLGINRNLSISAEDSDVEPIS